MLNTNSACWVSLLLILSQACSAPQSPTASAVIDEEAEQKAILETIETETRSFFTNKFETWQSCYMHSDETSSAWNNADGTFDIFRGYTTLEKYAREGMKAGAQDTANIKPLQLHYRNVKVKFFSPESAFVQYNQYIIDNEGKNYHQTLDERIMQKESGKWKIYNVTSIWNYKNKLPIDSLQ